MWPRYLIVSCIILFLAIVGVVLNAFLPGRLPTNVTTVFLYAADIMAVNYLYRFGRFAYTRWRNVLFMLLALGFAGILFRLQHWPYANVILSLPNLGIPVIYTIWFFGKKNQTTNDFLKLLWVILNFTNTWLEQMHIFSTGIYGTLVSTALLQFTYIQFWLILRKKLAERTGDWDFDKGIKA